MAGSMRSQHKVASRVSPPTAADHLTGSAVSSHPEPVAASSPRGRASRAKRASKGSGVTSVRRASPSSPSPEALPRPPTSSFIAAVSGAAAHAPEAYALFKPSAADAQRRHSAANPPVASAPSAVSWASVLAEQASPQVPVDIYGNPLTLTAWQLPEKASDIPTPSSLPSEERDEPKTPAGPSTIAVGFEQLKKLFMGASRQQPDTGQSTAAPTPAADDAASSGAFDSSHDATEYVEDS
ncbi:hypothetical protein EPH_0006170 [Eimeria praecox]|uniref:Uncharacterized protein n=1 Tax=Eimeria praecox TaxID=51316 RepID=U6G6F7_9EIME|nr:hypothetical protein EPH_0006170 [Eimeria praecox]